MLVLPLSKVLVDDIPDTTITRVDIRAVDRSTTTVIFSVSVSFSVSLRVNKLCFSSVH